MELTMKNAGKGGARIAVLLFVGLIASPGDAQDAGHGKSVFEACAACHATDHANRVGPGLEGIVGRKAGTVSGFRYSNAMKNSGIVWDEKWLNAYLESPQKAVPGNRMPYPGLKDTTDRADLIAFLTTLK
jgi:cytochrome c